jgi:hypothetical protein
MTTAELRAIATKSETVASTLEQGIIQAAMTGSPKVVAKPKKKIGLFTGCLLFIGGPFLAAQVLLASMFGGSASVPSDRDAVCSAAAGYSYSARNEAVRQITKALKAPSTAAFDVGGEGAIERRGANCEIAVEGHVDAQNGFGAMLRSPYRVVMNYDANSQWVMKSVWVGDDN